MREITFDLSSDKIQQRN